MEEGRKDGWEEKVRRRCTQRGTPTLQTIGRESAFLLQDMKKQSERIQSFTFEGVISNQSLSFEFTVGRTLNTH